MCLLICFAVIVLLLFFCVDGWMDGRQAWAQQVMWEVLNFAVIAAVCIICCPSDHSRMLSYASQLPTEDPDDDEEGLGPKGTGLYDEDGMDDDDEFEYEYGASPGTGSKSRPDGEEGNDSSSDMGGVELSDWKGRIKNTMNNIGSKLSGNGSASPGGSSSSGFAALPSAEDDEEFGLKDEQ